MLYSIISFIFFFVFLLISLRVANHFNIIDRPNHRSSHTQITIRGGGMVFVMACLWAVLWGDLSWTLFGGIALASLSGFVDDVKPLRASVRLVIHFVSLGIVLWSLQMLDLHLLWIVSIGILFVGWVNAFNFMDGINGLTVFYGLSALLGFYFVPELALEQSWIGLMIGALLVFGFFNVRIKAWAFAGDVGSISMAFVLGILMLKLIYTTQQGYWILFFAVYGIDAVCTILIRLSKGENIFEAHRFHLYQHLANELHIPHVQVSLLYFGAQLVLNMVVLIAVYGSWMSNGIAISFLIGYAGIYLLLRWWVKDKILNMA